MGVKNSVVLLHSVKTMDNVNMDNVNKYTYIFKNHKILFLIFLIIKKY